MIASPAVNPEAAGRVFAHAVLGVAAQIDAAERAIKLELLRAAAAGDTERVRRIVERWLDNPPTAVAASLANAPHGGPQSGTGGAE